MTCVGALDFWVQVSSAFIFALLLHEHALQGAPSPPGQELPSLPPPWGLLPYQGSSRLTSHPAISKAAFESGVSLVCFLAVLGFEFRCSAPFAFSFS
jgi:hypothetical protein